MASLDSFKCRKTLQVGDKTYTYYSLADAEKNGLSRHLEAAVLDEGAGREPAALRGRQDRQEGRHRGLRRLGRQQGQDRAGDRLPPGARADAGLHRRAGGGRPRRHARRHVEPRRRPAEDQPDGAGRPRDRPFRDRRRLRHRPRAEDQRRSRIFAQRRTLQVPEVGAGLLRQLPRRAARHRHLPPGQPRVPGADRLDEDGGGAGGARRKRPRADRRRHRLREGHALLERRTGQDHHRRGRLSRLARRHRLAHHHGQRPLRARLGRRRHRGRGLHAGPAALHAAARGDRLPPHRRAEGRRHRDRPGADRHPDAAQEGRRRQVRRVLRPRPHRHDAGRPCHHRQHGPGIRRHLRLLPDRQGDAGLPHHVGARRRPRAPGRALRQGPGPVPHRGDGRPGLHRHARARPRQRRSLDGRPQAARRAHRAGGGRLGLRHLARQGVQEDRERRGALRRRGQGLEPRPRRRRDCRHHLVHQHVQPQRADRRRPAGASRGREGPHRQALGEDLAGARQPGRRRVPHPVRPAGRSRQARLQPDRLRLHHLHRQLRSAGG